MKADNSWEHLFPEFRSRLEKVLAEAKQVTGYSWVMTEGYRSQEMQTYLYSLGRTRAGKIVTWMQHPLNHGAGMAADCYPTKDDKTPWFEAPEKIYQQYREIYQKYGLGNGAWKKGDLGHVELINETFHNQALAWVAAGFPTEYTAVAPVEPAIWLGDQKLAVPVLIEDGAARSNVKALGEALGYKVDYQSDTKRIVLTKTSPNE